MIINAGYDDKWKIRRLRLAPSDIEEAVARCGWTCLNDAEDISAADQVELRRLRLQGHAAMTTESPEESLKWWKDRLITPCELKPLYQHYIMNGLRRVK